MCRSRTCWQPQRSASIFVVVPERPHPSSMGVVACPTWPALQRPVDRLALGPGARCCMGTPLRDARGRAALAWHHGSCVDSPRRKPGPPRALGVAGVLYPGQIVLGALTAVTRTSSLLPAAHLVVGMGIFSGLLVAPLWQLESESAPSVAVTETEPAAPAGDLVTTEQASSPAHERSNGGADLGRCHEYARMWR